MIVRALEQLKSMRQGVPHAVVFLADARHEFIFVQHGNDLSMNRTRIVNADLMN